jgi:hypothetical protein
MSPAPEQPEKNFDEAENRFDLKKLRADLEAEKRGEITPAAWRYFKGVLCGYTTEDIAEKCGIERDSVQTALYRELRDFLRQILQPRRIKRMDWSSVPKWLTEAGYGSSKHQKPVPIDWQQICQDNLYYQRKQGIDSLTDRNGYLADRLDFVPLGLLEQRKEGSGNTDYEVVRTFYKHTDFFEPILGNGQKRPNSQGRRLAIIGDSGVGKTTFLLKTGFWLLEQTNELPIWIDLGKVGKKTLDEYLKKDWLREATGKRDIPSEWITNLEQHLENGNVCLLLDGVEKLSGTYIHPLKQIISQITAWVGKARIILTCRTSIWNTSKDDLFSFDFDTYQNLGFKPEQVKDFVTSCFANEAEQFWAELDQPKNQRIKDLARNPLYLRFLCSTWQPQCQLSSTKAELIRQFLDKDYDRNIQEVPDNPQKRPLFKALGKLALQAIKEGKSQLPRSIVCSKLGEYDEKLFQLVVNRLGWLQRVNPYQEVYNFLHDSLKEYLAACAIPEEQNWQYFLNHIPHNPEQGIYKVFNPQWKEVILFWLGREDVEMEQKEAFIDALLGFEDSEENFYRFRADFLAAVGIAEFSSCRRADEIVEWLVAIGFGSKTFQQPSAQVARTILLETNRSLAIIKLDDLITNRAEQCIGYLVAWGLGQVGMGSSQAITTLISLICTSTEDATHYQCNSTHYHAIESLGKITTEHTEAISVLLNLIHTRTDLSSQVRAAKSLGQISSCHKSEAINTLLDLMHPTRGDSIRCHAAHSLAQIAPEYIEQVTNTLIEIIDDQSTNELTRHVAAHNLKEITPNHPKVSEVNQLLDLTSSYPESPAELLKLICNSADSSTRIRAAIKLEQFGNGKDETINTLLYVICNSSDSLIRLLDHAGRNR